MRYRGAAPGALCIAKLDELTAIYDRRSGQTHIVAAPVPDILAALADEADLVGLIDRLELEDSPSTHAVLGERIDELLQTGLIERA